MGLCLAYSDFLASYLVRCQGLAPAPTQQAYADPILCQRFVASIAAGRMGFDPSAAATCAASLAGVTSCGGSLTLAGCDRATPPLVPLGGTCKSFYNDFFPTTECIGDSYCQEGASHACTGVCTARAAIGASCSFVSGPMCTIDAICDVNTSRCAAPLAANQPCVGPGQASCQNGFYCDTSRADGGTSGLCQPQRQSGVCTVGDSSCAGPSHCVGPSGAQTCAPPKQVGDACTPGARECDGLGFCGSDGKCTDTLMAVGQACGSVSGEIVNCQTSAYCVATTGGMGVCQLKKQPGAACTGALGECDGNNGHCDTPTLTCVVCPP
jgi:hypothetical protein